MGPCGQAEDVDVDLLSAESVHPHTQGVARALGIVDTLESKHVDVEPMRGVPVVDVDDHMSEVGLRISDPAYKAGSWTRRWTANMNQRTPDREQQLVGDPDAPHGTRVWVAREHGRTPGDPIRMQLLERAHRRYLLVDASHRCESSPGDVQGHRAGSAPPTNVTHHPATHWSRPSEARLR